MERAPPGSDSSLCSCLQPPVTCCGFCPRDAGKCCGMLFAWESAQSRQDMVFECCDVGSGLGLAGPGSLGCAGTEIHKGERLCTPPDCKEGQNMAWRWARTLLVEGAACAGQPALICVLDCSFSRITACFGLAGPLKLNQLHSPCCGQGHFC